MRVAVVNKSVWMVIFVGLVESAAVAWAVEGADGKIDFAHQVVPILKQHCAECHGGEESEGGFSLNTRDLILDADVATPGKANESRLIELVTSKDSYDQMPPKDRARLSAKEVSMLRTWIDQGIAWQDDFTFADDRYEPPLRPRRPELPPTIDGRTNPVDRILDAYLAKRKLNRPQPLGDAAFIRRLYLDVIGLLPTPEQLASFLADGRPDKRSWLVRDILANNQAYAEHWLSFWNDLLRNSYSGTGYIDGGRKQITGWLYRSLAENKPYDQFVRELISPTPESDGFIRGIKWRGNVNASQTREVQFAQSISHVFLGINMKCASCHDSFIDRWTLEEAYGLAAVYATRSLEIHRCDKPTGKMARPAWIFPELGQIDPAASQPERLKQLAALMTHAENGRFTRIVVNRVWHRLMGRGIVHPVDAMHTEPWHDDLLDYLAVDLADNQYDLKKTIELIVTSRAYQSNAVVLDEEPGADSYAYTGPLARRMTAEQFLDAIRQITDTWPQADARAFQRDGRQQGGQLAAILAATGTIGDEKSTEGTNWQTRWNDRPIRASLTPLNQLQASLGRPNREQVVTTRPSLLTTLEAINLANGESFARLLSRGASNVVERHNASADELIDWLFVHALSRKPTGAEREVARELSGSPPTSQGVEDLLWAVVMVPEFQLIR